MSHAPRREPVVFLFDVDNTLLDNDRVIEDLKNYLTQAFGVERQQRYWAIFEEHREELGYADYLGALQRYRAENGLPLHPLYERGYRSVGCAPCTAAVGADDDERAGRWAGRGKTECGLHTDLFRHKDPSEVGEQFVYKVQNIR